MAISGVFGVFQNDDSPKGKVNKQQNDAKTDRLAQMLSDGIIDDKERKELKDKYRMTDKEIDFEQFKYTALEELDAMLEDKLKSLEEEEAELEKERLTIEKEYVMGIMLKDGILDDKEKKMLKDKYNMADEEIKSASEEKHAEIGKKLFQELLHYGTP